MLLCSYRKKKSK